MALYHCSVKAHSRARGGPLGTSAVALAAYRAAERLRDERTGRVHDYRRKQGVTHTELITPGGGAGVMSREQLWQAQEQRVRRRDGVVAREVEIALPHELSRDAAVALARQQAAALAVRYRTVVDCCVHAPVGASTRASRAPRAAAQPDPRSHPAALAGGDKRNIHAHLLICPYEVRPDGSVGARVTALDPSPQFGGRAEVRRLRAEWSGRCNSALERAGVRARVDHRTLVEQGIDRVPQGKRGRAATHYERRTGLPSQRGTREQIALAESPLQRAGRRAALHAAGDVVTPPAVDLPAVRVRPAPDRLVSVLGLTIPEPRRQHRRVPGPSLTTPSDDPESPRGRAPRPPAR